MGTYRRKTFIEAPLETVWAFHSQLTGLRAVMPPGADLEIQSVIGPHGEPDPRELFAGTEITMQVAIAGLLPVQSWRVEIAEREETPDHAWFTDVAHQGPLPKWSHTHTFVRRGTGTVMTDEVTYELPRGVPDAVGEAVFKLLFAYRHYRTRQELED